MTALFIGPFKFIPKLEWSRLCKHQGRCRHQAPRPQIQALGDRLDEHSKLCSNDKCWNLQSASMDSILEIVYSACGSFFCHQAFAPYYHAASFFSFAFIFRRQWMTQVVAHSRIGFRTSLSLFAIVYLREIMGIRIRAIAFFYLSLLSKTSRRMSSRVCRQS